MKIRCVQLSVCILLLGCALASSAISARSGPKNDLAIPAGKGVAIDRKFAPGEWNDAKTMKLEIEPDWKVTIFFKYDATNLYFAFQGLVHGKEMRFPEFLIDPQTVRSAGWTRGQWWLHSSFNLCEGNGEYSVYERNGVFQCAQKKPGWSANHFPLRQPGVMEVQISFAKLGIEPKKGARFGFAMDLTDTQKNWTFWPANARLAHPNTWGIAKLH